MSDTPILTATNLRKRFFSTVPGTENKYLTALDRVNLTLDYGESLGIAGESGCGKSTLGKILSGLTTADEGDVFFQGTNLKKLSSQEFKKFRATTQMIFQDPFSSLNPRMRVGDSIAEPMLLAGIARNEQEKKVNALMTTVGLSPEMIHRFPDEFSGGQRQRIGIARALAASPSLLIADEPVSALDISIQAQIINLLQKMKHDFNLSLILISHNLSVLHHLCDRIVIMYLGIIVEDAPARSVFSESRHPYTRALLAAIPSISRNHAVSHPVLTDDLPSPFAIPSGCRFHPRCHYAQDICTSHTPELRSISGKHRAACHFADTLFK